MKLGKLILSLLLLWIPVTSVSFQNEVSSLTQGVFATNDPIKLPLPTSGYQVYLVGEAHGIRETKSFFIAYLSRLYRESSLRDVVLEEDQVYEEDAQAFVQGRRNNLPVGLCLQADILSSLREFNGSLPVDRQVRVHLIDIDSPEQAIRQHLLSLKNRIGASAENLQISDKEKLSTTGTMPVVDRLADLTSDRDILAELRTVRQSLIAGLFCWTDSRLLKTPLLPAILSSSMPPTWSNADIQKTVIHAPPKSKLRSRQQPPARNPTVMVVCCVMELMECVVDENAVSRDLQSPVTVRIADYTAKWTDSHSRRFTC